MVKYKRNALDATFTALGDAKRRSMLQQLAHGEASVTELAEPLRMSLPAIHKHLNMLKRAGLITHTKTGRVRRVRLSPKPLDDATQWISQQRAFWEDRFDALADQLEIITKSKMT
jgi:DNA-binding transcriptional ArsR family regulator